MYDDNGHRKAVPHYYTDEAHRTLGVMLAPNNNNALQMSRMRKITLKFNDKVRVGFIRGQDIHQATNSTIMRSLNWPLPAVTLTKTECTHIMTLVIKSVLAKMKVVSIIKRHVLYGQIHIQGMGSKNLYTLLGEIHCSILVQFYNSATDLGKLLQTSLECLTMELGLSESAFHYDYTKYSMATTHSWMKYLWEFCYTNGIILQKKEQNFPNNRMNDRNSMEILC